MRTIQGYHLRRVGRRQVSQTAVGAAQAHVLRGAYSATSCGPREAVPGAKLVLPARCGLPFMPVPHWYTGGRGVNLYAYHTVNLARIPRMRALNRSFS